MHIIICLIFPARPSPRTPSLQMATYPTPTFTGYLPCVSPYNASAERVHAVNQTAFRQQLAAFHAMAAAPPQLLMAQPMAARQQRSPYARQLPARFRT
jgi:hypothetical protein